MPTIKERFRERLIEAGYYHVSKGQLHHCEIWTKGPIIASLGEDDWQLDYSDEVNNGGEYSEELLENFEQYIELFDHRMNND